MIEDFTLQLLAGGFHRCTPEWSREAGPMDRCFKCYLPIAGAASVRLGSNEVPLRPGRVHLFDGRRLSRQHCPRAVEVHWVHFAPSSLYLQRRLELAPAHTSWPAGRCGDIGVLKAAHALFDAPPARSAPSDEWACRAQAFLLGLVARHLARTPPATREAFDRPFERLRAAVCYMDDHFIDPPPLAALGRLAGLSPEHFHRRFRALIGVTPFAYMLRLRMTRARRLLHAGMSVKEAADRCGYEDPLYFSRVFHRCFGRRPSACHGEMPAG